MTNNRVTHPCLKIETPIDLEPLKIRQNPFGDSLLSLLPTMYAFLHIVFVPKFGHCPLHTRGNVCGQLSQNTYSIPPI